MHKFATNSGITLIEVLLTISIVAILGVSVASVGARFLVSNYLENKTNELISFLQTAQINSLSGKENSNWGVKVANNQIILFKGSSYITRDPAFDLFTNLPNTINVTNQEIVFNKITGNPTSTISFNLSNNIGQTNTVSINALGIINVN